MKEQQIFDQLKEKFVGYDIRRSHEISKDNHNYLFIDFAIFHSEKLFVILEYKETYEKYNDILERIESYFQVPAFIVVIEDGELFFYKSLNEEALNFIEFQESLQELTIGK